MLSKWSCGKTLQSLQQDGSEHFTLSGVQHCTAFFPAMFIFALRDVHPFSEVFKLDWNFSLICVSVCSLPRSSLDCFAKVLMHQVSKRFRELSISGVGAKHMLSLLDSLSEKFDGSNGISRCSDGVQIKGLPSSFDIWIYFEPLLVVKSGPSFSLVTVGKVDMFAFCLTNCVVLNLLNASDESSLSYWLPRTLNISNLQCFSATTGL